MGPLILFVIPYLHYLAGNASLNILKGRFIESRCDWVLGCTHRLVVVLYVTWIEMRVEEFCVAENTEYSMNLGPPMKKFMTDGPISSGALCCHQS